MKKILLLLLASFMLASCSKDCKYTKAQLEQMMQSEIKSAGSNWQKIDLIIQKYNLMAREAC
jgi:uncharacterized protein YcfL